MANFRGQVTPILDSNTDLFEAQAGETCVVQLVLVNKDNADQLFQLYFWDQSAGEQYSLLEDTICPAQDAVKFPSALILHTGDKIIAAAENANKLHGVVSATLAGTLVNLVGPHQGGYDSGAEYAAGEIVEYAGSSWISLQNGNTGNTPTSGVWWWLFVGVEEYIHDQGTPSATWTIDHNLNKFPQVTIVDSGGTVVIGEVEYTSANQVVVTFNSAFGGKAYLG